MKKKRNQDTNSDYVTKKKRSYTNGNFSIITEVKEPSYSVIGNWLLENKETRSIAYDFWARGNYTRRLIHNRNSTIKPLIIPFSYLDELKFSYRRLSLLGYPAEYVYIGPHLKFNSGITVVPKDLHVDAGWGYVGAIAKSEKDPTGYEYCFCGEGLYLPNEIFDWLISEAYQDFINGNLFISNGELIGITKKHIQESISAFSDVTCGTTVMKDIKQTQLLLELDIPFIDNMSSKQFLAFRQEYESDLLLFRRAFKKLFECDSNEYLPFDELKYELAEIQKSSKYNNFRNSIKKLGGILTTFTVSAALFNPISDKTLINVIAAAGVGAATKTLLDIWTQSTNSNQNIKKSPFSLLWDIGLKHPSNLIKKNKVYSGQLKNSVFKEIKSFEGVHWLCPPTVGMKIIVPQNADLPESTKYLKRIY
ncbi:MAG: hypothetical protein NT007_18995 [Candidatus Kapabacteria bacterium]|nr:hypothetical protein [Candidatus Kapabacteria bacterium]